jgi:hypothetical protein
MIGIAGEEMGQNSLARGPLDIANEGQGRGRRGRERDQTDEIVITVCRGPVDRTTAHWAPGVAAGTGGGRGQPKDCSSKRCEVIWWVRILNLPPPSLLLPPHRSIAALVNP